MLTAGVRRAGGRPGGLKASVSLARRVAIRAMTRRPLRRPAQATLGVPTKKAAPTGATGLEPATSKHGDLFAPVLEDPRPLALAARRLAALDD